MYRAEEKRYENMKYRRCGNSGLFLPEISLGLWHNFGDTANYDTMKKMCFTAFDNGITHFDLANNYGPEAGSAEKNFSRILQEEFYSYRDEMIISTKAGYYMWEGPYGEWGSRKYMLASLDQSLKRMQLDYVDIFYHHRMDMDTPLEETMGALATAVQSGKALYVGLSNYNGERLEQATKILKELHCPFIINQNRYSIFDREVEENGLQETTYHLQKGFIVYSPLAQGQLTNRYLQGIPKDSRVYTDGRFLTQEDFSEKRVNQIKELSKIAKERGEELSQMALTWILQKKETTSVLVGASKPEQILENLKAIQSAKLTEEEKKRIDEIAI